MTEKLLPEMPGELWAKRLPDGAIYDAHGNADRDAVRYIRADLATPAPVIREVEDIAEIIEVCTRIAHNQRAMFYTAKSGTDWNACVAIGALITVAKTAAPGFTREELYNVADKAVASARPDTLKDVIALNVIDMLIDMGVVSVRE